MKTFAFDFNNILTDVLPKLDLTDDPRKADRFLLWQDVRGGCRTLCEINRDYLHKPVTVVQHGRGATRDYCPPNNFEMFADTICVWGEAEVERLRKIGKADRAVITGSPLKSKIKPRPADFRSEGNIVVFVPVVSDKEVADNLEIFYTLKQIEIEKAKNKLVVAKDALKEHGWNSWHVDPGCVTDGSVPYSVITKDFKVVTKLTQIHDKPLYMGSVVQTAQQNKRHVEDCVKLLQYASCVVGLEEGTFQLLAMAMDIPVVMVEGFKYGTYGGLPYNDIEVIRSEGAHWTDVAHLREAVEYALAHPETLAKERRMVVEKEFCPPEIDDPIKEIINVVNESQEVLVNG